MSAENIFSRPAGRRTFLGTLAGVAGVTRLMAATDKVAAGGKVKIAMFDAAGNRTGVEDVDKVVKSDEAWKKQLTPEQFTVTRKEGTERAGTGKYAYNHAD